MSRSRRKMLLRLEPSSMTRESLLSFAEQLLTSQDQYQVLLPSLVSERLSTLGTDGSTSLKELVDTLMAWYDTLSRREREKFWTLSLDFLTIFTSRGTPSREPNSCSSSRDRKAIPSEGGVFYDEN